jgi:acetoin utilization deacetylase AcuC-like enzyme
MAKFHRLRAHHDATGLSTHLAFHQPDPISWRDVQRVHTADYARAFRDGSVDERAQRRTGFKWSAELVERTRLEVGGTLLTLRQAIAHGLACNAAGGTHHAHADFGSGYCLLNDLAIASATVLDEGLARRILIVDLDVHQGDGTAAIFADDPRVFTFSMHARDNFPARKQASDHDVPLARDTDDATFMRILANELVPLLERLQPDLVIYDAGVDVHVADRLGHLAMTDDGLARRDRYVLTTCRDRDLPTAGVIGGGYDRDLDALAARHAVLHREAAAVWFGTAVLD